MSSGLHVFPSVTDAEIQLSTILPLVCRPQVPVLICTDLGAFGSLSCWFFRAGFAESRGSECRFFVRRDRIIRIPGEAWIYQFVNMSSSLSPAAQMNLATSWKLPQMNLAPILFNEAGEIHCLQPMRPCYNSSTSEKLSVIMSL